MTTAGAENVTLTVCRKPLVKDCDGENDEEICSTHYEAECITNQHLHQVIRKYYQTRQSGKHKSEKWF